MFEYAKNGKRVNQRCILVAKLHEGENIQRGCFWRHYELYYDPKYKEFLFFKAWNGLGNPDTQGSVKEEGEFKIWYLFFFDKWNNITEEVEEEIKKTLYKKCAVVKSRDEIDKKIKFREEEGWKVNSISETETKWGLIVKVKYKKDYFNEHTSYYLIDNEL